jgi:hypothetical protein
MERPLSIRDAFALFGLVLATGCYDEQVIELDVRRTDPNLSLAAKVCRADQVTEDEHCKPSGDAAGSLFSGTSELRTSVHIVISDDSDEVLLKLFDGDHTQCGVITIADELLRYDVTVTATNLDWICDGACVPSAGCTY